MERDQGIYMSKNGQFTYQAVSDFLNSKLSRKQTAELLQVRERTVTRLASRIRKKGHFGAIHGNRGRVPSSPHRYNGKDQWCLIAAIDDASSDIPYAEFFHSEDTI